ncbi:hypothetical protein D3C81_1706930 [compost metagenome]
MYRFDEFEQKDLDVKACFFLAYQTRMFIDIFDQLDRMYTFGKFRHGQDRVIQLGRKVDVIGAQFVFENIRTE